MNGILGQLARSTLLPDDLATAILAGNTPPIEEVVMAVIVGCMDAFFVTINDPKSSWAEKRAARMALAVAFLAAMAVVDDSDAEAQRRSGVGANEEERRGGEE